MAAQEEDAKIVDTPVGKEGGISTQSKVSLLYGCWVRKVNMMQDNVSFVDVEW